MASNKDIKNPRHLVSWLQSIGSTISFSDYERVTGLQSFLYPNSPPASEGDIEAAIHKRKEAIRMGHYIAPLFFCFIPMWLAWIVPVFNVALPVEDIAAILCAVLLSGICYLLTFYKDAVKYRCNLAHARQNLLKHFQKEPPKELSCYTEQEETKAPIPIPKGCIRLLLLQELVKKEAKYPNIFDAPIDEVTPFYKGMIGFNEKNFRKMMMQYRRREDIRLDQENARSTHNSYLEKMIRYFHAIGEATLEQQAISLQTYINRTPLVAERKNR